MAKPLPPKAPRGKAFIVAWASHVAGAGITIRTSERVGTLAETAPVLSRIDKRLNPRVVLVDTRGAA